MVRSESLLLLSGWFSEPLKVSGGDVANCLMLERDKCILGVHVGIALSRQQHRDQQDSNCEEISLSHDFGRLAVRL